MRNRKLVILFLSLLLTNTISQAQIRSVLFIIKEVNSQSPEKSEFFMAGSMNNWNPADRHFIFLKNLDGQYELKVTLAAGINEFKITRGSWENVESQQGGQPVANRTLILQKDTTIYLSIANWQDNFKSKPREHTSSPNVHILDSAFNIPQLNRKRRVWVYLPPDYETSGKKYPVIYMHDGQNLFDSFTSGYGEWGIDETMDSLYKLGKPMSMVVGIDHGAEYRLTEYNPYSNKRFGKGMGDEYTDFLATTLKPFIDQKYRTRSSAKNTIIAGSSMGGLISLYAAAKYPKVFGRAGVFSPAFWVAPEIYSYLPGKKFRKQKLYFIAGELESNEMVPDMKKIYDQLFLQGVKKKNMRLMIAPDGKHSEWFWHREYTQFYNWIMN
jgi:predicted alpha/beta superfamily hydrolase